MAFKENEKLNIYSKKMSADFVSSEPAHYRKLRDIEILYVRNLIAYYCRLTPNC